MAARVYRTNSSAGESTTTSTSNQTKCSLFFTPDDNSTWLWLATSLLKMSSTIYEVRSDLFNLNSSTTFGSVAFNPKDTTDYYSTAMMGVQTFGTSPGAQTIRLRYSSENASGTASIKDATLTGIQLDATEPHATEAGPVDCTGTSYTDVETLTHTFLNGEDYYVLCSAQADTNNVLYDSLLRAYDGTTAYGTRQFDHDDAANDVPWMTVFKITGDGTSKTIKIQGASSSAGGTNTVTNAVIVPLRASLFDNHYYAESRSRSTTTTAIGTSWQDKATLTETPEALEHLIIGCGVVDAGSTSSSAYARLLEDSTSKGEHLHEGSSTGAAGGAWPYFQGYVADLANASTTWKTQYGSESGGTTTGFAESALLVLQLEATPSGGGNISATGLASTAAFGSATVGRGAVNIAAAGLASTTAFGSATVTNRNTIAATGLAGTLAFGSATITVGAVNIAAAGIPPTAAFGSATVSAGAQDIAATGIPSTVAFGSAAVARGAVTVSATGVASTVAFGSAAVTTGTVNISATGVASTIAFGAPVIGRGAVSILATGLASTTAFGSGTVSRGAVNIAATGIASTVAFGDPLITAGGDIIQAQGIPPTAAFGSPGVATGAVGITAQGIASTAQFGSATVADAAEGAAAARPFVIDRHLGSGARRGVPTGDPEIALALRLRKEREAAEQAARAEAELKIKRLLDDDAALVAILLAA